MKVSTIIGSLAAMHTAVAAAVPAKLSTRDEYNVPAIDNQNFIDSVVRAHWYWRRIHCAQDLTWDPALAELAKKAAEKCTEMPEHDSGGQNLSASGPIPTDLETWYAEARTMVHGWHEEEFKYPYNDPHYDGAWGHFTQMVWRDSSRVGCAQAACPGKTFPARFFCNYERAGNNVADGAFAQNVWGPVCPDPAKS
ncbi:CAP domain-containing protein [Lophiotrema nucula]|uniref:CAP domain-containing protein n=1 Tax=Lophiotrema nucula TaxID=690887 RepID=A0A6A5ZUS8_9PLEO|nr:CAP domain-containing protein [Lophiotrema nucula]